MLEPGLQAEPTLVMPGEQAHVMLTNTSGLTKSLMADTVVATAEEIAEFPDPDTLEHASVRKLSVDKDREEWRHAKVVEMFSDEVARPAEEKKKFIEQVTRGLLPG